MSFCKLELRDGRKWFFNKNSDDPNERLLSASYGTQNPGGYGGAEVILGRPSWVTADQAPLLAGAVIDNENGDERYKGRVTGTPEIDVTTVKLDLQGIGAELDDDEYFRFLGVLNDLTGWDGPSPARQEVLATAGTLPIQDGGVEQDSEGLPALATRLTLPIGGPSRCEKWLRPNGLPIGRIMGTWKRGHYVDETNVNFGWYVRLSETDVGFDQTTLNLRAAGPDDFDLEADSSEYKYATILLEYLDVAALFEGTPLDIFWVPSVFGTHGYPPVPLDDGRWGLLDRDVVMAAISGTTLPIDAAQVKSGGFIVPNVDHTGTRRELIEFTTAYGGPLGVLNDWGVYESFFWRPPGWGRKWRVRRDEVATPAPSGPEVGDQCSGIVIVYNDGAGKEWSVGPPDSGADYETPELEDRSPRNIASRLPNGRVRQRDAGITTREGAITIGVVLLREYNQQARQGTVEFTGTVEDAAGNQFPADTPRACDTLVVADDKGIGPPEELPITSTQWDDQAQTNTASVGNALHPVDALLQRLQAGTPT